MAIGPGRYDDVCTMVREQTNAVAAIVIVVEGDKGNGFSVQTLDPIVNDVLPTMLEEIARGIRAAQRIEAAKRGH